MTKYILHGGLSIEDNSLNKKFYSEIITNMNSHITILMVYFAREEYKRKNLFEIHKRLFKKSNPKYKINFLYASENPNEFRKQVKQSQVMFIEGGSSLRLLEHIKQFSDIKKLIRSMKVYVGSSAGASLIVKYSYPTTRNQIEERLGLIPIKLINHYNRSKKDRLEKLESFHPELEAYALKECEFMVL